MATLGSTTIYLIKQIRGKCIDKLDAFMVSA